MTAEPTTLANPARTARTRFRLLAVAVAVVAPILVWLVASAAGVAFEVASPFFGTLPIDVPLVILSTVPLALVAWGLLVVLERRTPRARPIWTITAVAVLVLSLPPLAFLDATEDTRVALAFMHVAAGLPLILMLRHGARAE